MQKHFRYIRIVFAIIFFIAILISFSDIKANIPSGFYLGALYFQFIPSILKLLSTGAIFSIEFLVITIIGGRIYYSTFCPLGVLQDIII